MVMETYQARRFFRLLSTLLSFGAQELGLEATRVGPDGTRDAVDDREVERMIWDEGGDLDIIMRYVERNPFGFNAADLSEVASWFHGISGEFCVCQVGPETLFLYGSRAFAVKGFDREVADLLVCLPCMLTCTLLPFDDCITYAGTLGDFKIVSSPAEVERIRHLAADYYKLDKVHHTSTEFIRACVLAREEQLQVSAQELVAVTEAEMRRKLVDVHEGLLASLSFEDRQKVLAAHYAAAYGSPGIVEVLESVCTPGEPTDSLEELLRRGPDALLVMLGSHAGDGNDVSRLARDELIDLILAYDPFAPDHVGWLMETAVASSAAQMRELKRLYASDGPLSIDPSAMADDTSGIPVFPLSALFETDGGFLMQAPREARRALAAYDFDAASERAEALEVVVDTLEVACDLYGIVLFDEFERLCGFSELTERYGDQFAALVSRRIVALVVNKVVRFEVFYLPDGSTCFAHRSMRQYLQVEPDGHIPDFAETPVIQGMMLSRKTYVPRPLADWGEATTIYDHLYALESTRALVRFLDAHVPDTQDELEFADQAISTIVESSRLASLDAETVLDGLADQYDLNVEGDAYEELVRLYEDFADHMPGWYYYGWSAIDISQSLEPYTQDKEN